MISPALFNIYSESLIEEWQRELFITSDRIFGYADDHAIILSTIDELRRAIEITNSWCHRYNITLNPKKSGILEIPGSKRTSMVATELWLQDNKATEPKVKGNDQEMGIDQGYYVNGLKYIRKDKVRKMMKTPKLTIGEKLMDIPIVATYKYLGLQLTASLL
jgi:hypothetical protein